MSSTFALGKKALGLCDICGQEYLLKELQPVIERTRNTGLRACPTCWDEDHPQNALGTFTVTDPQAIRNARPDTGEWPTTHGLGVPVPGARTSGFAAVAAVIVS